jgi:HSP20 family protein
MANINVRKEEQQQPTRAVAPAFEWDPSRFMRQFLGWDPFREMMPLVRTDTGFMPAFEVKENKEGYLFKADLPGVKESDIDITIAGDRLTISGKRTAEKQEQTDTYYTYERSFGSFTRSFTLPSDADMAKCHAELRDGVLTLLVPRKPEAQPKKIAVQTPAK